MSNYKAHTTVCIDLGRQGYPVTTLGMKMADVAVVPGKGAFGLTASWPGGDGGLALIQAAMANFSPTWPTLTGASTAVLRLFSADDKTPVTIVTPDTNFGAPNARKALRHIEFHGNGYCHVRLVFDDRVAVSGHANFAEYPTKPRKVPPPRGTKAYAVRAEFVGPTDIWACEYKLSPMPSES